MADSYLFQSEIRSSRSKWKRTPCRISWNSNRCIELWLPNIEHKDSVHCSRLRNNVYKITHLVSAS